MTLETVVLAVNIGTLMAVVYTLRILVLMEARVARMEQDIKLMKK